MTTNFINRCSWVKNNGLLINYHDNEWGRLTHDDNQLFEHLSLEQFQAGLNWLIILEKRQALREAFNYFLIDEVASFNQTNINQILNHENTIHHQSKILAIIHNAKIIQKIQQREGSFDYFIQQFINHQNFTLYQSNKTTIISNNFNQYLKSNNFKFIGPIISHSFLQSIGYLNPHEKKCFLNN